MKIYKFVDKTGQKCDTQNGQNFEAIHYKFLQSTLKCNLPWARFKLDKQDDCSIKDQMKEYFEIARQIDKSVSNGLIPNCQFVKWTPETIHIDLNQIEYQTEDTSLMMVSLSGLSSYVSRVVA